ncbi:MAG: CoA transferase [Solirubrobacterales bacterium]
MSGPLSGLRIADFSLYLPGPYATRLLADLGAEVVKIEPLRGDPMREFLPGVYEFVNRGKRSIRLDLKRDDGLAAALALVGSAGAALEGFRPGVAERLGIGFEACAEVAPDLVYCSLSGFGQTGPDRDQPGHDIAYEAAGGGYAGVLAVGEPLTPPPLPAGDLGGALFAALTICAHLSSRRAGDGAVRLDLSMLESLTHLSATRWGRYLRDRVEPELSDLGSYAPGNSFYETADRRWVALAAVEDKFWQKLCAGLGREDLAGPPYDSHAGRMAHRGELREALAGAVGAVDAEELLGALRSRGAPAELVRTAAQVCADPHLRERGTIRELGDGLHVEFPALIDGERPAAPERLPDAAVDGPALLAEVGLDADRLIRSGAVGE